MLTAILKLSMLSINESSWAFLFVGGCNESLFRGFSIWEISLKRTVCGVGYIGEGHYKPRKDYKFYRQWTHMLQRCYTIGESFNSYQESSVCEEWHDFQNYCIWAAGQKYSLSDGYEIDKDLLSPGNKNYSPIVCCFIPKSVNTSLIRCGIKPDGLPYGVIFVKRDNLYRASYRNEFGERFQMWTKDVQKAISWYAENKEVSVRKMAEIYKESLDSTAYDALKYWKLPNEWWEECLGIS